AAVEAFLGGGQRELNADLVRDGFAAVTSPGRLELVRGAPSILVDAGHNPDGIRVTAEAIKESFGFTRLVLMVGILAEKDAEAMLYTMREEYGDMVEDICITQSSSPRAIPAGELSTMAIEAGWPEEDIHVTENLEDAIEWSVGRAEAGNDLSGGVLVTGSITLVGEISLLLKGGES
ncbi:cyanophycin synthetase, partial [Glutamicibacter sp.]